MRANRYFANKLGISRRKADALIKAGKLTHQGSIVSLNDSFEETVTDKRLKGKVILVNKPVGYVCSRHGQGSQTIFDLVPKEYQKFMIAGRLDKDSCGLVVLSNDGNLVQQLQHPSQKKVKTYLIKFRSNPSAQQLRQLRDGVDIGDSRPSQLDICALNNQIYRVKLQEGRNRQIRRSAQAVGLEVVWLQRQKLGPYQLDPTITEGKYKVITVQ